MKNIFILLLISMHFLSAYSQLNINKLKTVTLGQSPAFTKNEIGRIMNVVPTTMCSDGNLFGVKEITYKNFSFDYFGTAKDADFFYIKDSLLYVEIDFIYDLEDSLTFKSFLTIVFNKLDTDPQLEVKNEETLDIKKIIRIMANANRLKVGNPKDYHHNVYYINGSNNYFQTFIGIAIINNIPKYRFLLRLDNFNMYNLEQFYVKEVGYLPLSSSACN